MSDNPYESPRADLRPRGERESRYNLLWDRVALVVTAFAVFLILMASQFFVTYYGWQQHQAGVVSWALIGMLIGGPALVRRLFHRSS